MKEITGWFERQAQRQRRRVHLEDALLLDRFPSYARYRLRFFAYRYVAASAVHAVRVLLLAHIFSQRQFGAIVLAHALASVVTASWWGLLEEMRAGVRRLYRTHHPDAIPKEIGRWLALSVRLTIGTGLLASLLGLVAALRGIGPADLYLLAIAVRLAMDFVLRCYHSGIYAIRRVYRPLPTMLAVDAAGLVGVVALWPLLGQWSFGAAALLSTSVGASLVLVYTRRTYRFFGFDPWKHVHRRRRPPLQPGTALAAAAGAALGADGLVVLALVLAGRRDPEHFLVVLLFALAPTLRAAADWAQLFYFDLKRLEPAAHRRLRGLLQGQVAALARALGLGLGAVAALAALVIESAAPPVALALAGFFLGRSVLAAAQIAAFTDGHHLRLALSGMTSFVGFAAAASLADGAVMALLGMAASDLAGLWVLRHVPPGTSSARPHVLGISEWLQRLAATTGSCTVGALEVRPPGASAQRRASLRWHTYRVGELLVKRVRDNGCVSVLDGGRVVWFEVTDGSGARSTGPEMVVATGGLVVPLRAVQPEPDGAAALRSAIDHGLLEPAVPRGTRARTSDQQSGPELLPALLSAFDHAHPGGVAFRPGSDRPPLLEASSAEERRALLHAAFGFLADFRPRRAFGREITATGDGEGLQCIFISPPQESRAQRQRWRSQVVEANLALISSAPRPHPSAGPRPAPVAAT